MPLIGSAVLEASSSDRLDSWKEIASHLRRTVRTVQRWERHAGLPVRRHHHDKAASVYASRSELDQWWQRRPAETCVAPADVASRPALEPIDDARRIIILPFTDLSPSADHAHLCEGIVEELTTALGKVPTFSIPRRTAVASFWRDGATLAELTERFRPWLVIEGSVRRVCDRVRVLVRITRTSDGAVVWADGFEGAFSEVLALEERLQCAVLTACGHDSGTVRLQRSHSGVSDAYDLYLMSRHYFNTRTLDGLRKSIDYAERALERDSSYALAAAALSTACATYASYTPSPPAPYMDRARAAAWQALSLDEHLSEAHMALGFVQLAYDWKWIEADRSLQRAIQLDPRNATAHQWSSICYLAVGDSNRSIKACADAERLDPASPIIKCHRSWILYMFGRNREALATLRRTAERYPEFWRAYFNLAFCYVREGRGDEAVRAMETATKLHTYLPAVAALVSIYALVGREADAERLLQQLLDQTRYVSPYWLGVALTAAGRPDEAMQWLWRSYDDREWYLVFAGHEPVLDPLRKRQDFQHLLAAIGL